MKNNFGKILLIFFISVFIILWMGFSIKTSILYFSLFTLLMWLNITLTTLGNAFIGRDIDINYDIAWKITLIVLSSIGFSIYFTI